MDRENSMRAIGLVLLSIAIMALLLTDADAKRRQLRKLLACARKLGEIEQYVSIDR